MIGLSSVALPSALVPPLSSAPQCSFNAVFDSAASADVTNAAPEITKNPASTDEPDARGAPLPQTGTHILPRVSADPSPLLETDISKAPFVNAPVGSPDKPDEAKSIFRARPRLKPGSVDPAPIPENSHSIQPAGVPEAPIDRDNSPALPASASLPQQSLGQAIQTDDSKPSQPSMNLPIVAPSPIAASTSQVASSAQNRKSEKPLNIATELMPDAVFQFELSRTPSVAAKPSSALSESSIELAPVLLPEIDGANDTAQPLPSVSFQQHVIQSAASTAPAQPAVNLSQLNLAEGAGWIDTLARDIAMSAANDGRLIFRLLPERLGQLDIVVNHSKGNVDITMQASTDAAASMIAADQPRLVEELQQSGLRVGHFEMTSGQHGGSSRQQYASPSGAPVAPPPINVTPQGPRQSPKRSDRFA